MGHARFEVILQQDVPNLGTSGEVVRVRPGYARNYLIPNKLAVAAMASNRAQLDHQKREAVARAARLHASASALAQRLAEIEITISAAAGDDNRLYGAITSRDIAASIEKHGLTIDRKAIQLSEPIKRLGSYDVSAKLGAAVTTTFKVSVVAK
jgi:large subunit ribosomal protein L9